MRGACIGRASCEITTSAGRNRGIARDLTWSRHPGRASAVLHGSRPIGSGRFTAGGGRAPRASPRAAVRRVDRPSRLRPHPKRRVRDGNLGVLADCFCEGCGAVLRAAGLQLMQRRQEVVKKARVHGLPASPQNPSNGAANLLFGESGTHRHAIQAEPMQRTLASESLAAGSIKRLNPPRPLVVDPI